MGRQRGTPLIGRLDTRKEHYLPRFFLRRFVDDKGTLSVISRADEGGRPCLRPNMRVENVASVNGLYETAYPGGRNGTYYFPNYIEKSLSSMETALGRELGWTLDTVLGMRPSDRLSDDELSRIMGFVSCFIPHIVSRSPQSVDFAKRTVAKSEDFLEAMRKADIDSDEKLKNLYREVVSDEGIDESMTLDPDSLGEHLSLLLQMMPAVGGEEVFDASPLHAAIRHLMDCSLLLMTTSVGHPFIGLDKPIRARLPDPCTIWYYPLSSRVAAVFTDDRRHTFEKRSIGCRTLRALNKAVLDDEEWSLVFCEREDYLEPCLRDM